MADEVKLNLKWDSFSSQLTNSLDACYEKQYFVDLSLVCKSGAILKCHKMVLSNASSFFRRLLVGNEHPHPMIILHDIEAEDLKTIVNFMYCGEIQVAKSEVTRILKIAETLEVSGLKDIRGTVLIPETNNSIDKNPKSSGDTKSPAKIADQRSLAKNNMADLETSSSAIEPIFRKRARTSSNFEERNNEPEKRLVTDHLYGIMRNHTESRCDLTKKNVNVASENNVKMYNLQDTSARGISCEKSNIADDAGNSSMKKLKPEEQISWNQLFSEIAEEKQGLLQRLCLMEEVEITASTSRTEPHLQYDEPPQSPEASTCLPASEPEAIYIKEEIDIASDSECEANPEITENYESTESDTLTVDTPIEMFKRVHCIGGTVTVSPKHISLFELLKKRGSSG